MTCVTALDPDLLLLAYASGVFPMADSAEAPDVYWVEPKKRGILPLDRFHVSHSLAKTLKSSRFHVSVNQAFEAVLSACADRAETWINPQIHDVMLAMHARGNAHSVEVWRGDELIGGLYGVALGKAFFGESMFSRATDASKVALAALVARLRIGGFSLLDCQFITPHLASLGAVEISRDAYCALLSAAVESCVGWSGAGGEVGAAGAAGLGLGGVGTATPAADFFALESWAEAFVAEAPLTSVSSSAGSPWLILQALTQTS